MQQNSNIMSCPSCGTRNRVSAHPDSVRPVCGKCKCPLPKSPSSSHDVVSDRGKKFGNRLGLLMVVLVVGVLFGVGLLGYWQKEKGSEPARVKQVASTPPKPVQAPQRLPTATGPAPIDRRLSSGTVIKSSILDGNCQLAIENGLDRDAAAKLVKSGSNQCIVYFYVSSKSTENVKGMPDGSYRLLFSAGRDWDENVQCFTRDKAFSEFDGQLTFETVSEVKGDKRRFEYRGHRVTLHKVRHGNAPAHGISEAEFLAQ